jgi:hypothetical protein
VRRLIALGGLLLVAGCSSGHHSPKRIVISAAGRIGPLKMDRSTPGDIISFLGKPGAEARGVEFSGVHYRGLGYGCSARPRDDAFPLLETPRGRSGPSCRTAFWINRRTGRLGDFYTSSPRFSESHGVHMGMKTADAERLVGRRVYVGCEEDIHLGRREAELTIAFAGGVPRKMHGSSALHLIGGRVYAFALHGPRSDIGIFDCL